MFALTNKCWLAIIVNILFVTVIQSVRITKVSIPEYYVIEKSDDTNLLVLDCEYELQRSEESGLVIKWTFEGEIIYQWIPRHKPHVLRAHMRDKIDVTYKASSEPYHQYRALALVNPTWNSTGTYTCLADTFESNDKKSGFMQIIDRSNTTVEINRDVVNMVEEISCIATQIYPQPILNLTFNDEPIPKKSDKVHLRSDGLFDVTTVASSPLIEADTEGEIACHIYFPKTNYTMETIQPIAGDSGTRISQFSTLAIISIVVAIFNFKPHFI